ncbi:hypothetical protein L226DRAFT_538529 [Lentinus tigrinus ALCF2SS1-7]|uniref:Uncharacterized protein n=1 Tax=Lentinus tigrinus ALCF2SS1-6 TaxID=1328759 RepID=A0A5C2S9J1_9APHY|nr:hypothetical protein L227DRAFT_575470 [Lentinus tigrinus ALCF2SS1-6]RPD70930.1 hypothetical protein L226DRAFT_538529 [Lentinus tigrinus ALCF2SS1-7]
MAVVNCDTSLVKDALKSIRTERIRRITIWHTTRSQSREKSLDQISELRLDDILPQPPFLDLERVTWVCVSREPATVATTRGGRTFAVCFRSCMRPRSCTR